MNAEVSSVQLIKQSFDQSLKRTLLIVVISCVLVWYTVVTTPGAPSPRGPGIRADEGGERKEADNRARSRMIIDTLTSDSSAALPERFPKSAAELEWPEVIDC